MSSSRWVCFLCIPLTCLGFGKVQAFQAMSGISLGWRRSLSWVPSLARWCLRKDYNSLTSNTKSCPKSGTWMVYSCFGLCLCALFIDTRLETPRCGRFHFACGIFLGWRRSLSWLPSQARWCLRKGYDSLTGNILELSSNLDTRVVLILVCVFFYPSYMSGIAEYRHSKRFRAFLLEWRRNLSWVPSLVRWCLRKDYNSLTSNTKNCA